MAIEAEMPRSLFSPTHSLLDPFSTYIHLAFLLFLLSFLPFPT